MDSKVLLPFLMIGLLYYVEIVSTLGRTDDEDDPAPDPQFSIVFSKDSVLGLAGSEVDDRLDGISTEIVKDVPFISPEKLVTFQLFTRYNPREAYMLKIDDVDNLKQSPFNNTWHTKVLIHGYQYLLTNKWIPVMRNKYLKTDDYNVINVNWDLPSTNEYLLTTHLTRLVGERTGKLLAFLHRSAHVPYCNFHLLGHSLGAHVAGFAGANVSGAIGRITGMDPAGPYFETPEFKRPEDRLDPTDARFVDVIHTDSGNLGFRRPIGHVDFYPNGGSSVQPGCPKEISTRCDHFRSVNFMADSIIYPDEFVAIKCDNWKNFRRGKCSDGNTAIMGEDVSPGSRGKFYLRTNSKSPYGQGDIAYDD